MSRYKKVSANEILQNQFGAKHFRSPMHSRLLAVLHQKLGYPPRRIDILTTLPGIEFSECYPAHTTVDVEGISVNFIDLENLKKNKKATGRHQDLADLENLE